MSDTFRGIAERASSEKQVIRKSQFSKEIFSGKSTGKKYRMAEENTRGILIIC